MMMQSYRFPWVTTASTTSPPSNAVSTSKSPDMVRTRASSFVLTRSSSTTITFRLGREVAAASAGAPAGDVAVGELEAAVAALPPGGVTGAGDGSGSRCGETAPAARAA